MPFEHLLFFNSELEYVLYGQFMVRVTCQHWSTSMLHAPYYPGV